MLALANAAGLESPSASLDESDADLAIEGSACSRAATLEGILAARVGGTWASTVAVTRPTRSAWRRR